MANQHDPAPDDGHQPALSSPAPLITDRARRAWRDALDSPTDATRSEVAAEVVHELQAWGLAEVTDQSWSPLPPRTTLRSRAAELSERSAAVLALAEDLGRVWEDHTGAAHLEIVSGERVTGVYQQLLTDARRQVRGASVNSAPRGGPLDKMENQGPAMDRGLAVRALYEVSVMGDPAGLAAVRDAVSWGEQARVLPTVPLAFMVCDDDVVGMIPPYRAWADRELLVTRHPGLVRTMADFFELLWDLALGVSPAAWNRSAARSEHDVEQGDAILMLLAAGSSDHAIARELGISERTLSRRISELQLRLGARTRFQLGFRTAEITGGR